MADRLYHAIRHGEDFGRDLKDFLVIDAHSHMYPDLATPVIHTKYTPWGDDRGMLATMDELGIDLCMITGNNDDIMGAVARRPDRFIGYAHVNPAYPDEIPGELERCFSGGCRAIGEIHPANYTYWVPLDHSNWTPVWEFAVKKGCPVLVHTGPQNQRDLCGPELVGKVARWYPSVPFILGHTNAWDHWEGIDPALEAARANPNVFLDINCVSRWYGGIEYVVRNCDEDRIVFGCDVPWMCFTLDLGAVLYAKISQSQKEKILGLNMARLLGLRR